MTFEELIAWMERVRNEGMKPPEPDIVSVAEYNRRVAYLEERFGKFGESPESKGES